MIRTGRSDDKEICVVTRTNVLRTLTGAEGLPDFGGHRLAGHGFKGQGLNKTAGGRCHSNANFCAPLGPAGSEICGLVGGDSSGHTEEQNLVIPVVIVRHG